MAAVYTALIRTFNSESYLKETLKALYLQTHPPESCVFVDSGSADGTRALLPDGGYFHAYEGQSFNYSEAINQGLDFVKTDYVLIISSHTVLANRHAIEYALQQLEEFEERGAAYFHIGPPSELRHHLITKRNFDGFNGLCNTCALIKMEWLASRRFRQDVFAAEDQEWAAWLLREQGKTTVCVEGAGMNNTRNVPYLSRYGERKYLNEQVAVAYFVNRRMLSPWNIARIAMRAVSPIRRHKRSGRLADGRLAIRLAACWFSKPTAESRYFR